MLSAGAAPWYPHQVSAHCSPGFPSGSPDGKRKGEKVFRTWHKPDPIQETMRIPAGIKQLCWAGKGKAANGTGDRDPLKSSG